MLPFLRAILVIPACCLYFGTTAQTGNCNADFSWTLTANLTVSFQPADTLHGIQGWDFGDGSPFQTGTLGSITHHYSAPGSYQVRHYLQNTATNCRDSVVKTLKLLQTDSCHAEFSWQQLASTSPGSYAFAFSSLAQASTAIKNYNWSFGDSTQSADANPVHVFHHPGTYLVCLNIETVSGCHSENCRALLIVDSTLPCTLSAHFTVLPDSLDCQSRHFFSPPVQAGAPIHYNWNFGDGSSSQDAAATHRYAQPGKYYVCLVVEGPPNCRAEFCDSVLVSCPDSCHFNPRFSYTQGDSTQCQTLQFTNYIAVGNTALHYTWSFGDGSSSTQIAPRHYYPHPGRYLVCLQAAGTGQCRNTYCDSVTVLPCSDSCHLEPGFVHYSSNSISLQQRFEALYPDSTAHFSWAYGDGSYGSGRNSLHVYAAPGTYTVCLEVSRGHCSVHQCQQLRVGPVCDSIPLAFDLVPGPGDRPNEFTFRHGGPDSLSGVQWWIYRLRPGAQDSTPVAILLQPTAVYRFSDTGWYRICLRVNTAGGCIRETCRLLHIDWHPGQGRHLQVYPNPAHSYIRFELNLDKPGQVLIKILNGNGLVMAEFSKTGVAGNNTFTVPVEQLNRGYYFLEIITASRTWYSRFHKD